MAYLYNLIYLVDTSCTALCNDPYYFLESNSDSVNEFIFITWLMTSCIECSRMPRAWSGLQESNKNTVLSCISEAGIGSANHRKQSHGAVTIKWRNVLVLCVWDTRVWVLCLPGGQVLKFKPESDGCSSLSIRPRERREGEKMTGLLGWTCTGCTKLYGIRCSSWP